MWRMHHFQKLGRPYCLHPARYIFSSANLFKSHYDVLGLTPKATQSDIKAAYYKLSMMHHPDKNKGADTAAAFRDITAAYEVLGNYRLRKLYDKGLLHTAGADHVTDVYEHPEEKFYQSRSKRHTAPSSTGKTPIYDFDEWARQHYTQSFNKRASAKARWERSKINQVTESGESRTETTLYIFFLTVAAFILTTYFASTTYDVDQTQELASQRRGKSVKA